MKFTNLTQTRKLAVALVAVVAPLALGWVLTAGSSTDSFIDGIGGHHTIDTYEVDGYEVEREDIDGAVTNIIIGPDGTVVTEADAPAAVRDAIDTWTEPVSPVEVIYESDAACYRLVDDATDSEGDWEIISEDNGNIVAIRMSGGSSLEAVRIVDGPSAAEIDQLVVSGAVLTDLPGAVAIDAC